MEVVVTATVGPNTTKKDISATFAMRQVSVAVEGEVLFEGIPGCELDVDECFWEIDEDDENKKLVIHLAKRGVTSRWPAVHADVIKHLKMLMQQWDQKTRLWVLPSSQRMMKTLPLKPCWRNESIRTTTRTLGMISTWTTCSERYWKL